jgi:hypothetical protein
VDGQSKNHRIMLMKNIWTERGLLNGTFGTMEDILSRQMSPTLGRSHHISFSFIRPKALPSPFCALYSTSATAICTWSYIRGHLSTEESRILRERGEGVLNGGLNNTYLPTLMEDSNYFLGSTATFPPGFLKLAAAHP